MSAQSLVTSSVYPIIRSGSVNTPASQVTNITFDVPYPSGVTPLVYVQNNEGAVWPTIFFTVQGTSNTGFSIVQTFVSPIVAYQSVTVNWLAVWIPGTILP
jgi:hypothetical protein